MRACEKLCARLHVTNDSIYIFHQRTHTLTHHTHHRLLFAYSSITEFLPRSGLSIPRMYTVGGVLHKHTSAFRGILFLIRCSPIGGGPDRIEDSLFKNWPSLRFQGWNLKGGGNPGGRGSQPREAGNSTKLTALEFRKRRKSYTGGSAFRTSVTEVDL